MSSSAEKKDSLKKGFLISFKTLEGVDENGPLNFLWQLIESYKVDIFEVKLSQITDDFISHMTSNKLGLEEEAEFTVMAARLLYYKSKLLLPNPGFEDDQEQDSLPFELVEQLLEYKKFQQAADVLREFEDASQNTFSRLPTWKQFLPEETFLDVDLMSFLLVFKDFLEKQEKQRPMEIKEEEISNEEVMSDLLEALKAKKEISFFSYIIAFSLLRAVVVFLVILELAKLKQIKINQAEHKEDIFIALREREEVKNDRD